MFRNFSFSKHGKGFELGIEKYIYYERQHYDEGGTDHGLFPDGNSALVAGHCIGRLVRLWIMETLMESAHVERDCLAFTYGADCFRWQRQHLVQVEHRAAAPDICRRVFHEA